MEEAFTYRVSVHEDDPACLWAEVEELPGCFATGENLDELIANLTEAIGLYISTSKSKASVTVTHWECTATERELRVLVTA